MYPTGPCLPPRQHHIVDFDMANIFTDIRATRVEKSNPHVVFYKTDFDSQYCELKQSCDAFSACLFLSHRRASDSPCDSCARYSSIY